LATPENGLIEGVGFLDVINASQLMVAFQDSGDGIIEEIGGGADIATTEEPPIDPERPDQMWKESLPWQRSARDEP
jgi:hypothetical protein